VAKVVHIMSTQVFFRGGSEAEVHRGHNSAKLNGSASGWLAKKLATTRGAAAVSLTTNTVAGTTLGVEATVTAGGDTVEFISPPIDQAVTIAGAISVNLWGDENNMSANVGAQIVIERLDSSGAVVSTIVNSEDGAEMPVTTPGLLTWSPTPTSTAMLKGDRFRIRLAGNDIGTMGTGFTFVFRTAGPTGGADGDSFITLTETFGFQTTNPTGSQLFLTDTASPVSVGTTEREMWTSRGGGVVNDVTNTSAGWVAAPGIQTTDTAGGAAVEWYSKALAAFTLSGVALANVRALESAASTFASLRFELAVCDGDGTNPVVWASSCPLGAGGSEGQLLTTESAWSCLLAGDDVAVTAGQRLRFRVYVEDTSLNALVTGQTVTTYYNGTTADASGDSYVTLTQTVTEFIAAAELTILVMAVPNAYR